MAAARVQALAGAVLRGHAPSAQPPRPLRVAAGSPLQRGLTLGGAFQGGRGGSTTGLHDKPESTERLPASGELTAAERRIAELHAEACAVSSCPTTPTTPQCACACARPRPSPGDWGAARSVAVGT